MIPHPPNITNMKITPPKIQLVNRSGWMEKRSVIKETKSGWNKLGFIIMTIITIVAMTSYIVLNMAILYVHCPLKNL